MTSRKIRIGGVPEHFNLPIHLAMDNGLFKAKNIDVEWKEYEGGTGQMSKALQNDECDICIVLTEGVISAIINGNPSKVISGYVKTPLIWGVHTGIKSKLDSYEKIFNQKIAISRIGSGSHLMPTVDAMIKGKTINPDQFVMVKNIEGAIDSLNSGESDVFYWEKYTTKPFVKKNMLKRIGEFISPWPCFVMAATQKIINTNPGLIDEVLDVIHQSCDDFMNNPEAPAMVSKRHDISLSDAKYWFHATEWANNSWVSDKMISSVLFTLKEAGLLPENSNTDMIIWKRH